MLHTSSTQTKQILNHSYRLKRVLQKHKRITNMFSIWFVTRTQQNIKHNKKTQHKTKHTKQKHTYIYKTHATYVFYKKLNKY